ncbi:hypothetical protein [Roseobacter ponti]|uniref:Uncharacterized protein n=1 Tax=Roseobacter ponti TaxID=1891787 RepID=A0A858SNW8_9RHOB|nr:hypothetical protein [Roseobacter ponti]QJF50494.1 hypothetical protein G3256_04645 [Roseobacter ponti]
MNGPLDIKDVVDRGKPNSERIPILVNEDFYLQYQWIGLGIKQPEQKIFPINDNCLWLGSGQVYKGDWIFVYTGKGNPTTTPIPSQDSKIYTVHWNRSTTLFNSAEIHPYLLDGGIILPPSFTPSPSLSELLSSLGKDEEG